MTPAVEALPLALRYEFKGLAETLQWRMRYGLLPRQPEPVREALALWLKARGLKRPAPALTAALANEIMGGVQ